ncbi:unnamed protein product [Ilex paraguariensis]|uniref:Uncharacterized protein n=1 Tax=Ilex paraguariensis TaxID=185542 RepID=A0ABC8R1Z9_9AQUA
MMGLGYLGHGGSASSSSNLSALAPPFTVDRSNSKLNSNPIVHFTDSPYAAAFDETWLYPHSTASRPDFVSNLDPEVDSPSLPLTNDYRYPGSQSINPQSHWSTLNPTPKTATDAFSYPVGAKPYYPLYVSPEPCYDPLLNSGGALMDVSPQVDYTRSLSPLECTPQWGGFWNGLPDEKRGKRVELDGSFYSVEKNISGSHVYKNYINQGVHSDEERANMKKIVPFHWENVPMFLEEQTLLVLQVLCS